MASILTKAAIRRCGGVLADGLQVITGPFQFEANGALIEGTGGAITALQSNATANQSIAFPDASGTLALVGDTIDVGDLDIDAGTLLSDLVPLSDLLAIYDASAGATKKTRVIDMLLGMMRKNLIFYHDRAEIAAGWANNGTSGSGAAIQNAANYVGAAVGQTIALMTGSTTTGRAGRLSGTTLCVFGTNPWHFETTVGLDTLSDGTNTYTARFGFMDSQAGDPTDGAYFRYTHGTNSGKWECVTRSNNVETASALDSGITVDTSLHNFSIDVNAAGTSVDFKIDGATVATGTANIPTGTARATGFGFTIIKSAGGTNRNLNYTYTTAYSALSTPAT